MKVKCYLILGQHPNTGKISVRRSTKTYPALDWNEAVLRLELDVPDDLFEAPLFTVEVAKRQVEVAVGVEEVGVEDH